MRSRRSLNARLDLLADRKQHEPDRRLVAYVNAVIAFGGAAPTPAMSETFARWLERGGWRGGS